MMDTERALFSSVSVLPLIFSHEFLPLAQRILFVLVLQLQHPKNQAGIWV